MKEKDTEKAGSQAPPAQSGNQWFDALSSVFDLAVQSEGPEKTARLAGTLMSRLRKAGVHAPRPVSTPYVNTIPTEAQAEFPGDLEMERRIKSIIRWNAMAMVVNANRKHNGLGGHISTFASSATLYEVAFNHFYRGPTDDFSGDMWFEVSYRAPGFALPVGEGLEFTSPAMAVLLHDGMLFRAAAEPWADERKSEILLYYTQLVDVEERIGLPRGYAATFMPESEEVDRTYAYFKGRGEAGKGTLTIFSRAEVRRRQIPPEGYEGFLAAMREARDWSSALFRVEPAGEKEEGR